VGNDAGVGPSGPTFFSFLGVFLSSASSPAIYGQTAGATIEMKQRPAVASTWYDLGLLDLPAPVEKKDQRRNPFRSKLKRSNRREWRRHWRDNQQAST
jgi:hypothetical protein